MAWWPDNLTDWIVIASGIATAVLVFLVWKQFGATKREMKSRLRAYIGIGELEHKRIHFANDTLIDTNEANKLISSPDFKILPVGRIYHMKMKNVGGIPTTVDIKYLQKDVKFSKEELENSKVKKNIPLVPQQEDHISVNVSLNTLDEGGSIFAGLMIEYNPHKEKKSKVWRIWEIKKHVNPTLESGIDDPDMEKSD